LQFIPGILWKKIVHLGVRNLFYLTWGLNNWWWENMSNCNPTPFSPINHKGMHDEDNLSIDEAFTMLLFHNPQLFFQKHN
jgi:hypothetical protein